MSLSGIILSRLRISGDIDISTPLCVLEEILDSHRIGFKRGIIHPEYRESLIIHIKKLPLLKFGNRLTGKDLRTLVTYINIDKTLKWTRESLFEAYVFLDQFSKTNNEELLNLVPSKFICGPQTPESVYNLNACVLYRICKSNHIRIYPHTPIETMANAVRLLKGGPDLTYKLLSSFVKKCKPLDIINIFIEDKNLNETIEELEEELEDISHESLNNYRRESPYISGDQSPNRLAKRILPISKSEAVGLGALIYKKDFSLSKFPISEFLKYAKNPYRYIPVDENLREIFVLNPNLIDLKKVFNPIFPQEYYDPDDLIEMASQEGYAYNEITTSNSYELLQLSYLLENFYEGLYPEIENTETPIAYDEISELDPGLVICYGIRREGLIAFNIEELIDHFSIIKTFAHPVNVHNTFSESSIRKLKKIAEKEFEGTSQSIIMRRRLFEIIEEVEFLSQETNRHVRDFYDCYNKSSEDVKTRIRFAIKNLLNVSMYMRGWKGGESDFPIREAPVDNQYEVDLFVTNSITDFETICEELGEIGENILSLPLLKYQGKFNPISSEDHGFTIRDRINIVKMGDDTGNIQSCIRLTSNILAATAYRYMVLIGLEAPFPIGELRYIS